MEIITGDRCFQLNEDTAIAIGKFDGIHLGHQLLFKNLLKMKEVGLKTVVFTFDKPPLSVFLNDFEYRELDTIEEKRERLEKMGIDYLIEFPTTKESLSIPANEFISEILCKQLRMKCVIAGDDVSYGYKGAGDSNLLRKLSQDYQYETQIIEKLTIEVDGKEIQMSSTYVRGLIENGRIEEANLLLEKPFSLYGEVVYGNQLGGSVLDTPTANVIWPLHKIVPKFGVYFTKIKIENTTYCGVTNIGKKPTVEGENLIGAETYIFGFNGNIYGEYIEVRFCKFKRDEQKFGDLDILKEQINKDVKDAKEYFLK